jgi:hypothetical protein
MAEIFISFKAESLDELTQLLLHFAFKGKTPPSWLGAPLDAEALQAEAEARERIDAEDAAEPPATGNGADHQPEPTPTPEPPAKRARAARAPRVSAAPALARAADEMQAIARGEAEPARTHAPTPPVNLPPLDTLKAIVTNAVRLAQKGEGSKTILDLLPGFKDTTGLTFVMNAEDKHRPALYDLVQAAGLSVV